MTALERVRLGLSPIAGWFGGRRAFARRAAQTNSGDAGQSAIDSAVAAISGSQLLDADWYLSTYPDVAGGGLAPAEHYVLHGVAEGRDPGPNFSTNGYLSRYPDVANAAINPLLHYLSTGSKEGRVPGPDAGWTESEERARTLIAESGLFQPDWYLAKNPDVAASRTDPLRHFLRAGRHEARDPGPDFDVKLYAITYPDVADSGENPLVHYLASGRAEARRTFPASDRGASPLAAAAVALPAGPGGSKRMREAAGDVQPPAVSEQWLRAAASDVPAPRLAAARMLLDMLDGDADRANNAAAFGDDGCEILSLAPSVTGVEIADVWFVASGALRLRLAGTGSGQDVSCACFMQGACGRDGALLPAGCHVLRPGRDSFIDIDLADSFSPLLICVVATDGAILASSLLPFPSLCRGGAHYAELCAAFGDAGYTEALRSLSRSLLSELLSGGPPFAFRGVQLDLRGATGAERIFAPEVAAWLGRLFGLAVASRDDAAREGDVGHAWLRQAIAAERERTSPMARERCEERRSAGWADLILPADAIPTVRALVSRRWPAAADGPDRDHAASFLTAYPTTGEPAWLVSVPPMGEWLLDLQPVGIGLRYPVIRQARNAPEPGLPGADAPPPAAIRFREAGTSNKAHLILPLSVDPVSFPLVKPYPRDLGVAVMVSVSDLSVDHLPQLAASLALQADASRLRLLLLVAPSQAEVLAAQAPALARVFPGSIAFVAADVGSRGAHLNRAAAMTGEDLLLVCDGRVLLHDPRTVDILATLAANDRVASAACMLVACENDRRSQIHARSAGFLRSADPADTARTRLAETASPVFALASTTFPVAANSSLLAMVPRGAWKDLGGFDEDASVDAAGRIVLKADAPGYAHLCTTAVSAGLQARVPAVSEHDVSAATSGASCRVTALLG